MKRRLLLGFAVLALAVASAKSYSVTLFQPATLAGKELKPGTYKVEVDGTKAVVRSGKEAVEAPVKVKENARKFNNTSVRYNVAEGKYRIQEINLGGTKTTLVFE
jgi:hypothetical protein